MRAPDKGVTLIGLLVLEILLSFGIWRSEPFGHLQLERATHEYVTHPTPQNKETMNAEFERVYEPERKRSRIVLALLGANSCLIAFVGYKLVRSKG